MGEDFYFQTEKMIVGYDGKPLIKDIDIHVKRGQILTLIGPNGSGKSTILKSITRHLKTIGGTVFIGQEDMKELSASKLAKKLSVVLTERINPELMTCEDVVSTGRYPYTGALGILSQEDHKKVRDAMEMVHALELKDRSFSAISDGQRQRLLLARAICQEPEMIVLDEPTSFLDIRHKLELLTILKDMVKKDNIAVIMSLHELDLAQKVSDQLICVHGEYIEKVGSPEEVFSDEYIRHLYGITNGSYNSDFGCMELDKVKGAPQVFVIGGGGTAIETFRILQRKQIPFAAGVLHENDIDAELAGMLSDYVIKEKAFENISEASLKKAMDLMKTCKSVICTLKEFGTTNQANRQLMEEAEKLGLLKS